MKKYKMNARTVDVILPIYKPDDYVFETIESVLNQTYKDWILHIVDDASGDDSLKKIKQKYNKFGNKIKFYKLKNNSRQAYARNFVISNSNGNFVAFIDQDDLWYQEKLDLQVTYFNNIKDISALHTDIKIVNGNDEYLEKDTEFENLKRAEIDWLGNTKVELTKKLFTANRIRLTTSIVKRNEFQSIGGFNEKRFGGEDEDFWIRFSNKYKIGYLNKILVERKENGLNTSVLYLPERTKGELDAMIDLTNEIRYLNELLPIKEKYLILRGLQSSLYQKKYKISKTFFKTAIQKFPYDVNFIFKTFKLLASYEIKTLLGFNKK